MDEDRIKHSIAVARKMVEIAKNKRLSEKEIWNAPFRVDNIKKQI